MYYCGKFQVVGAGMVKRLYNVLMVLADTLAIKQSQISMKIDQFASFSYTLPYILAHSTVHKL